MKQMRRHRLEKHYSLLETHNFELRAPSKENNAWQEKMKFSKELQQKEGGMILTKTIYGIVN